MRHLYIAIILFGVIFSGCANNQYSHQRVGDIQKVLYGTIEQVRDIEVQDDGLGTIAGAIIGGLAGSAFGKGKGNKAAIVGGAIAGGYAGNQMNKSAGQELEILLESGEIITTTTSAKANSSYFRVNDDVKIYIRGSKITKIVPR